MNICNANNYKQNPTLQHSYAKQYVVKFTLLLIDWKTGLRWLRLRKWTGRAEQHNIFKTADTTAKKGKMTL